ncbi:MAG: class I SAM-dependent methyltransferase [Christensenellaceae bacterium]|jgi:23S rRNA (cytosine1962-C5)-methyltransferase
MIIADKFDAYTVLDAGEGMKLEDWGGYILARPDPQVIWQKQKPALWEKADATYHRSKQGGGEWSYAKKLPERWRLQYEELSFYVRPTGFKHTGLFPEQSANWAFIREKTKPGDRILNLFAYTGGATLAAASKGGVVTHVDAAKSMVSWAKENAELSGLQDKPIRYIVEDCLKFVLREQRRGKQYEAIIMDPPSYGRGTGGEVWHLEDAIETLVKECAKLLSDTPRYFIINSYTTGLSSVVTENLLQIYLAEKHQGTLHADNLVLLIKDSALYLPCGITARWWK